MEWHQLMDGAACLVTMVAFVATCRCKRWSQLVFVGTNAWFAFSFWYFDDNPFWAVVALVGMVATGAGWYWWDWLMCEAPAPREPLYRTEKIGDTWVIYDRTNDDILGWSRTEPTEAWLRGQESKEGK